MGAFSEFFNHMNWDGLVWLLLQILAVLICLTVHEVCHGLAAYALGDPTAKSQHRLSLNPLRHIDLFGALMMLVAGFGWAKPVPIDMRYFKHPKSGMALTALAGPVSNFLLAYLTMLIYMLLLGLVYTGAVAGIFFQGLLDFLWILISLSVGLGIFNLIPFPPLDGSKVVECILPDQIYYKILRYEFAGMLVLMVLLWSGILSAPLQAARDGVMNLLLTGSAWVLNLVLH